jgi:Domain of unknown function (DUF4252)/Secretion system C-terminal sorting domain
MKKICFALLLAMGLLTSLTAQNVTPLSDFIERHRYDRDMTYVFLSKEMFEVVSKAEVTDQDWKKVQNVVKDFGSLIILAADSTTQGSALFAEANRLIPSELEELLTVRDDDTNVRFLIKEEGDVITDLVLLVGSPDEFVLVHFNGRFELKNFMQLTEMFDAKAATSLAQSAQVNNVEFGVAPNPSSNGRFNITYTDPTDAPASVVVYDLQGRQVAARTLAGQATEALDLRDLPVGQYVLQLKTRAGKLGTQRIVIARP